MEAWSRPSNSLVKVEGSSWRVERVTVEQLVTKLQLTSQWRGVASADADPGRVVSNPDAIATPTQIAVFNLPDLGRGRQDGPAVHVAACQPTVPHRAVQLDVSAQGSRGSFDLRCKKRCSAEP